MYPTEPHGYWPPQPEQPRRRSAGALVAIVVTVTVLLGGGLAVYLLLRPGPPPDPKVVAELRSVVERNLEACETEDLSLMQQTLHPSSPVFGTTVPAIRPLIAQYDLRYELMSFHCVGVWGDGAVVQVKQKTTKIRGPMFADNIAEARHELRKYGDEWRIWNTVVINVKYLD